LSSKKSKSNFTEICPVRDVLFHANRHDRLPDAFHNCFVQVPKKGTKSQVTLFKYLQLMPCSPF